MGELRRRFVIPLAIGISLLAATEAFAQSAKEEAKRHFDAGNALLENEDYRAAAAEFEASLKLYPTKMGLFNLANCYKVLHRYGDALDAITRLRQEFAGKLGDLEPDVDEFEKTLLAMVGRIVVRVDLDGATVNVDGVDVAWSPLKKPLVLAPGDHVVVVRLAGHPVLQRTIRVAAGEQRVEQFVLSPAQPKPPVKTQPAMPVQQPATPPVAAPKAQSPGPTPPSAVSPPPQPPAAAQPLEPPPPPAAEESEAKNRAKMDALFWSGVGATAAMGILTGVFYGLARGAAGDFGDYKKEYAALPADDPHFDAEETRLWGQMEDASSDMKKYGNLGTGFLVVTAAAAVATTVVGIVAVKKGKRGESADAPVMSAAPGGLAVSF